MGRPGRGRARYELMLGRRLTLGSAGRTGTPATRVAVTAVALSVAVMLASIAIVLGFKREIRQKVLGFNPHITLYVTPLQPGEDNLVTMTESLRAILDGEDYISGYNLDASIPAILKTPTEFKGVYMRSLESRQLHKFLGENLIEGKIPTGGETATDSIVISRLAARALGLKAGDKIDTYFMSGDIRVRRLTVAGIFDTHFDDYDNVYIYGALPMIQQLGGVSGNQGTCVQIETDDFNRIGENSARLQQTMVEALGSGRVYKYYHVETALGQGAAYFGWLALLDTNVLVILILMMIVSIATLISGMLIIILDKRRTIVMLRALGATTRSVRRIFVYLALRVALTGMLIGDAIMIGLLVLQNATHILPLDPEAYYIDFVPVEMSWGWFAALNVGVFAVVWISLVLPSRYVAGVSPADAIDE